MFVFNILLFLTMVIGIPSPSHIILVMALSWSNGSIHPACKRCLTKKYFILPLARLFNFFLTGVWLSDAHNGFRVLSARAARQVTIEEDRMAHGTEILDKIVRLGLKFKEMPVTVHYHRYGQGVAGGLTIFKDLLLKRFS